MKPYSAYTAEELALDDLFVRWVQHPADAEVAAFWLNFLRQHPYRSQTVETARRLVQGLSDPSGLRGLSSDDVSSLWGRIRESLEEMEDVRPLRPEVRSFVGWWYFIRTVAAAASIILFISWALWTQATQNMEVIRTEDGKPKTVLLPDGSEVRLHGYSEIKFARQWVDEVPHAVWLRGEADFAVTHRKNRTADSTFRVHTQDLTIEALGTSFQVKQGNAGTHIAMISGEVKLLLKRHPEPICMRSGESVGVSDGKLYKSDY